MQIFRIYLFLLFANFLPNIVAYYKKCYEEFSLCLITNTANGSKFRLTRSLAVKWCQENSSSLAIITNETVQSAIATFMNDSSAKLDSDVITNGYRFNLKNWTWTNGRQSDVFYPNSNAEHRYAILVVSPYEIDVLFDGQSTLKRKFICSFLSNNLTCPDGHEQFAARCYKMHNEAVTWFDARSICLIEEGSDLATFEDGLPSHTFFKERRYVDYWIGLRKESWIWMKEESYYAEVKYSNWGDGKPSHDTGNCLCLQARTGKWTDCDCSQKYRYICIQGHYTPDSRTTVSTSFLSLSTDTSNVPSTPTQMLHGNSTMFFDKNPSDVSSQSSAFADSQRLIIWVPLVLLIVLIIMFAAIASCVTIKKLRKRKRLGKQGVSSTINTSQPMSSVDDYATLNPEYMTSNRTYAELVVYETIGDDVEQNPK